MTVSLSQNHITSFVGDVLPLHIGFDSEKHNELAKADIKWESDSDAVSLHSFSGNDPMCFNNGVLLILKKAGNATVTATMGGVQYTCFVTVTENKKASSDDKLNYYIGDLHNHTTKIHNHEEFINRTSEFQRDFIKQIKNEGLLDFCVMSDHAIVLNDTEFFRNFVEIEKAEPNVVIMLPGAESEVTVLENDRFGVLHKNSGEIVTFNTDGYISADSWKPFFECISTSPAPIAIFAHPCTVGIGHKGIWNFCFHKNNTPEMIHAVRGIETINGRAIGENLMHEFNYSLALDSGFRISSVASTDSHGPERGYGFMRAKTVLLAREKSREAFIDALRNNRFYATESGNVKLRYTVNGKAAPADLDYANTYRFHVELSYFTKDEMTVPVECAVISDGGKTLLKTTNISSSFDFEIQSDTARYFYLRFVDGEGKRTWSMPVWTGRKFDKYTESKLSAIDLSNATAVDILTGEDASAAIDGDVYNVWEGKNTKASIVIDMQQLHTVSAIGYYPRPVEKPPKTQPELRTKWREDDYTATLPTAFAIYTSIDGTKYEKKADGIFRTFGGETVVTFENTQARYVRFDVLSTVGADSLPHLYGNAKCSIGNLLFFRKESKQRKLATN